MSVRYQGRRFRFTPLFLLSCLCLGLLAPLGLATSASAANSVEVYVGYADTLHAVPANFPTPYLGSPGVVFDGCVPPNCDSGALRIVNNTTAPQTISRVVVKMSTCTFFPWSSYTLAPGQQLVLSDNGKAAVMSSGCPQRGPYTFDTSDVGPNSLDWTGQCTQSGVIPEVDVNISGVTSTFRDTAQVLNTGGVDRSTCAGGPNESNQWSLIGQQACPGASLILTPVSQTATVGTTATLTARLANGCNTGLSGANVTLTVTNGPNAGRTFTAVTGPTGVATFHYTSAKTGQDRLVASVSNPAGTITSHPAVVNWVAPKPKTYMTGRGYGLTAQLGLLNSPILNVTPMGDTGFVSTTATSAQNTCTPGVVVGTLLTAHLLCGYVTTTAASATAPARSQAEATVADVFVGQTILPAIRVQAVDAYSTTTCTGSSGFTRIAYLAVGNTVVIDHPTLVGPNTTLTVAGVKLVLNEQIPFTSPDRGLAVNGVHATVDEPNLAALNLIVAHAESDIGNC